MKKILFLLTIFLFIVSCGPVDQLGGQSPYGTMIQYQVDIRVQGHVQTVSGRGCLPPDKKGKDKFWCKVIWDNCEECRDYPFEMYNGKTKPLGVCLPEEIKLPQEMRCNRI